MFSLFVRRIVTRVPSTPALVNATPRLSTVTRSTWSRAFTTTPRMLEPAAATKPKTAATPGRTRTKAPAATTKRAARTTKKPATKKTAGAKTKAAPKPKKKAVNQVAPPKLTKEQLPPKRPMKPYTIYATEFYATNPSTDKLPVRAKAAGEAWKSLSDAEKEPYRERYQEARAAYQVVIEEYTKNTPPEILRRVRAKHLKKRKLRLQNDPTLIRTAGPFPYFYKTWYNTDGKAIHGSAVSEAMKAAAEKWRTMPDAEKQTWKEASLEAASQQKAKAVAAHAATST
ncbi:hypothetical protein EUX98_g3715 [Antrodiella citrinella]|uniref:HMG box domain-containing protein n=1 Tax=Antrodiella citrinella TaxID=2447956 RepID=A0A4S4MYL1_9APHY|nr:hypothetical protein EUX98_g3715 [Antrodiella citrinella]